MSYSIDEAIEDAERHIESLRRIAKKYPRATMQDLPSGDRAWCSDDVVNFTDVMALADKSGQVFFCVFEKVGNLRVYGGYRSRYEHSYSVLEHLNPAVRKTLIKAVLGK